MMRTKKLQKVMANFTEQIALVLEEELRANQGLIQDWVAYPHSHS